MDGTLHVFVSGTKQDLKPERKAVLDAIHRLQMMPHSMEYIGADDREPIEICLEHVRDCQVFLLVLGHRYGSLVRDTGVSYSEREFDHASDLGRSILVYVKDNDDAASAASVQCDHPRKLKAFREKARQGRFAPDFHDAAELAARVTADLPRLKEKLLKQRHRTNRKPMGSQGHLEGKCVLAIDRLRGGTWESLHETVKGFGYVPVSFTGRMNPKALRPVDVLFVPGSGFARNLHFDEDELDAIAEFVENGRGLLCAGQAWSWASRSYGNKPIEDFPLNQLGRRFGFQIAGLNIKDADIKTLDKSLLAECAPTTRTSWAASEIQLPGIPKEEEAPTVLVRDVNQRIMAALLHFGEGKVAIVGHEFMLKENPKFFEWLLEQLSPSSSSGQSGA